MMKPSSALSNSSRAAFTSTSQAASRRLTASGPAAKSGPGARNARSRSIDWGEDIRLYRLTASWMVGYAFDRERLLAARAEHGQRQVAQD